MKKIIVHGWVQDNSGSYHQAGATLTVDDDGAEGCITAKVADQLVKQHCASHHQIDHKAIAAK